VPEWWRRGNPDQRGGATPADSDEITNEILSEDAECVRRDLHVAVDRRGGDVIRIAVTLADADPNSAIRRVNDMVAGYAAKLHKKAMAGVLQRAAEIGSADQRVRQEVCGIREELDGLVDQAVSEAARARASAPSEPADRAASAPESPLAVASDSGPIRHGSDSGTARHGSDLVPAAENPERTEARKRLEQLQQHRAHLLVDRTPVHPEVLQVDTLIAEAEQRLATIPSRVPETSAVAPQKTPPQTPKPLVATEATKKAQASAAKASPGLARLAQAIQMQRNRMDQVSHDLEQTRGLDLQAAQRLVQADDLRLRPADHADPIAVRLEFGDLLLVALAAGLMATAGVGMIWTGAAFDAPLTNRHSVEHYLAIPIVGAIGVDQTASGGPDSPQAAGRWRLPYIVGGLAILAVYLVFLLHPLLAR